MNYSKYLFIPFLIYLLYMGFFDILNDLQNKLYDTFGGDPIRITPNPHPEEMLYPVPTPKTQPVTPQIQKAQASEPRRLDVERYQGASKTAVPQFSPEIQDLIWKHMGPSNDATPSAVALAGENAKADLNAINQNNDGSQDYGLAQNNTNTFNDLMKRAVYAKQLKDYGINDINDTLGNADKSIKLMQVARQYEDAPRFTGDTNGASNPWERWYGWQNNGYTIDPNKTPEELSQLPGNPYFKLSEYLTRQ